MFQTEVFRPSSLMGQGASDPRQTWTAPPRAKAFGEGAVRAVPATCRFDHNADAEELGSTVVHSAHMTGGFRKQQQQVPTAAAVAKEAVLARMDFTR